MEMILISRYNSTSKFTFIVPFLLNNIKKIDEFDHSKSHRHDMVSIHMT